MAPRQLTGPLPLPSHPPWSYTRAAGDAREHLAGIEREQQPREEDVELLLHTKGPAVQEGVVVQAAESCVPVRRLLQRVENIGAADGRKLGGAVDELQVVIRRVDAHQERHE